MDRFEYLQRARELARRGQDLPQTKLQEVDVISIRSAARQRDNLRQHIRNNLSNKALAQQFGVHERTIEKVLMRDTHCNVP
jgi:AraC-like DNA-binding protein